MADDERRAEIEAVARALWDKTQRGWKTTVPWAHASREARDGYLADARTAIAALDRVRDARGDDEGCTCGARRGEPCYVDADGPQYHAARSPERERCARDSDWCDGTTCREFWGMECPNADPPLQPDDEGEEGHGTRREQQERMAKARAEVSRVSPSRDGSVAVEEVAPIVIEALEAMRSWTFQPPVTPLIRRKREEIDAALAEFSPASTGDQAPEEDQ